MYQKEIIYMSLYKDGNRLGNAGFLKVEKRDKEGNLSLTVKNAPRSLNGRYPVRYYCGTDWKEADGIIVRDGGGQWEKTEEDSLEQIRLQIMLPSGYLIEGASREATDKEKPKRQDGQIAYISVERQPPREVTAAQEITAAQETDAPKKAVTPQETAVSRKAAAAQEAGAPQEQTAAQETVRVRPPMSLPPMEGLKEDKWEQILDTYDRIHPYGDERIYVKLEPRDFLILSSKYQHLVNNSFLLHGFYNYRHVILGKEKEAYYLGVPGVFYEREKMVALMFGFEAFECASGEPKAGEFGYYLRKVEL